MKAIEKLDLKNQLEHATRDARNSDAQFLEANRTKHILYTMVETINELEERSYRNQHEIYLLEGKLNEAIEEINYLREVKDAYVKKYDLPTINPSSIDGP